MAKFTVPCRQSINLEVPAKNRIPKFLYSQVDFLSEPALADPDGIALDFDRDERAVYVMMKCPVL